jgi:glycosyltransferase involved in cell wall biosynthesis
MRIAFFTPLSPLKTAIADHSEGLLPHMASLADVDLVIDTGYQPNNPEICDRFDIYDFHDFPARAHRYDAILYAMGDDASFHGYIYEMLQKHPGVVTLHDTTLHRTMIHLAFAQGRPELYHREMHYAYGWSDPDIPQQVLSGYGDDYVRRYPFFERVVDSSLGVIVHNGYARKQVLRYCPWARVTQINQHFFMPPGFPDETHGPELRARWGLENRFVVGSFGILVPHKRLDVCLRAFARFREQYPAAAYLLVGNHPPGFDLPGLIEGLGLDEEVVLTGWLDPVRFAQHMFLADIGIHLRYPHIGGTPFTPIRLMGLGIPTIVSDIGPLAALPEGACVKVPPDQFEEDTLVAVMEYLAEYADVRRRLGENGADWIREHHDAARIAARYVDAIRQAAAGSPPVRPTDYHAEHRLAYLVREMAAMASRLGIREEDDHLLRPMAEAIAKQAAA